VAWVPNDRLDLPQRARLERRNCDLIEPQLAHSERNEVRAAYNRAQRPPERRTMMQAWGDYIDRLREDRLSEKASVQPASNIVQTPPTPKNKSDSSFVQARIELTQAVRFCLKTNSSPQRRPLHRTDLCLLACDVNSECLPDSLAASLVLQG